ncbi:alpha/beta hydrolase family protein [Streptomyces cyanogenus]|uniref:Prolyl tripeptidyl peptidase n=1 Tax=Streptomyces cyanogenus TaxID=80860 RepID=A0ABX7U2I2_STRCY|nr:S9 family peptidase [Streptomyces cyanogenus]QTE02952.1 Prolyl tripeptidyl peptidase precursor [Streptomyces cyanogenus]
MAYERDDTAAFHDLLAAHSRLTGLVLAPDGTRLIASVQSVDEAGTGRVATLWEVDTSGKDESRLLDRSVEGDFDPAFAADGTLLFLSGRESRDVAGQEPGGDSLWALPESGEARRIAHHPGGIYAFTAAAKADVVAYTGDLLPDAADIAAYTEFRREREKAMVTAALYEETAAGAWSAALGPEEPHTFVLGPDGLGVSAGSQGLAGAGDTALSPDGSLVACTRAGTGCAPNTNIVVIADAATGVRRRTFSRPGHQYYHPAFTADGSALVCQRQREETYDTEWRVTLVAFELDTGEETDLLPEFDNWPWPGRPVLSPVPGDATLWFTGDERGHCPVFRRDADGTITRLTASGAYTSLCVTPDGTTLYALRSAIDSPPRVARLDAVTPDQQPAFLKAPGDLGSLPGTLTEVHTHADDGFPLRGWLVLPEGSSPERPAPLLVVPHGGPQASWSAWTWSWNPWPFAARGYAVLLPDPALSTGYGRRMQERGRGQYGGQPYRDVVALTDAALARGDLDGTRTALAGWSYGGYLANVAATLTDRFKAIVSAAGMWNLEALQTDTDMRAYFREIFGDPRTQRERYDANSPHLHAARVKTPMLLVHGGKDYRVPMGQALSLHSDLQRLGVPVGLLHFPTEGHTIGAPNHVRIMYETVLNFLDHHVLGMEWRRPAML